MAKKTFVVSDTWFNRPYGKYADMSSTDYNEQIINCWNDNIKQKDVVYVLGGFGIGQIYDIIYNLNGEIHFLNNYYTDEDKKNIQNTSTLIRDSLNTDLKKRVSFESQQIVVLPESDCILSYLPLSDWYGKNTGTYCFHGMEHVTDMKNHTVNCNAKMWNFVPVDVDKVINNIITFEKIAKNNDF